MVLGLAGRALLGGGKLLAKAGARAVPKVGNLASGIFSGCLLYTSPSPRD